jgi:FkbM family methyltransferase
VILLSRIGWRKGASLVSRQRQSRGAFRIRSVEESRAGGKADRPHLAFMVTGGVGDFLVIARFIRDLVAEVGDIGFDVFSPEPGVATWAFAKVQGFGATYQAIMFDDVVREYDAGFRVNQSLAICREHINWSALRDRDRLVRVIDTISRFQPNIEAYIDRRPFLDNFLARTAVFGNATRQEFLHGIADIPYGGARLDVPRDQDVVARLGLRPGEYVTVHNGFDTGFVISGPRATKCYPHFGAVVTRLKAAFPHLRFVQVGTVTSEPIPECDLILLKQTSLDEVAELLAQAVLHLDNEGGLVHLAACVGTRSTVVFGPTPSDYFGYAENINIDPPVCGNCWWMTRTWMDVCAKGYSTPRCMTEQRPEAVARRALDAIAQALSGESAGLVHSAATEFELAVGDDGVVESKSGADPVGESPMIMELRARLVNIEAKVDGILPRAESGSFRGHSDQAFGGTTYAQYGEDLIIVNLFHMLGIEHPSYLDVGAHHPLDISNTALLHSRGSHGINVEANPHLIEAFRDQRPQDINLNIGVGPERGEMNFYFIDDWCGRNTFVRESAEEFVREHPNFSIQKVLPISIVTLNDIVSEHAGGRFPHFLSLDVEGWDYAILQSATFDEDSPVVICTESEIFVGAAESAKLNALLRERGYRLYTRTVGNLIFAKAAAIEQLLKADGITPDH